VHSLQFGRFEVLPSERRLLVDGQAAAIGARAFDVLLALIERRDRVVAKNELFDIVWPHLIVEENNLQVQVHALRKLLGPDAIATIPGRGYRFTVPVAGDAAPAAAAPPAARAAGLPAAPSSNLPEQLPALYGREPDLQALQELIAAHPLVTVVGSGGIGKTRLAQAAAHQLRGRYPQGVWMVELASLNDGALLLPTIAQTLQVMLPGVRPELDELVAALHDLLLVLDNCERLLDSVSAFASRIARDAPGVRLLATSQELLRVPNEHLFRVRPLAVPDLAESGHAADFGAVRLFVERVRALHTGFALDERNVGAVIEICRRLDGIALAIELAAARVPLLGVEGIRERLSERFRMLTGGARVSMQRHQTLQAALDWSHELLSGDEQKVFRRLAVFAGGFGIEGAQRVAGDEQLDPWQVLQHLSTLVDKSLVLVEGGDPPRYRLLETARLYGLERLAQAGETEAWLRRHAQATQAILEMAVAQRDMDLMVQEMNNVRAAFAWAMGPGGDPLVAVALATLSSVVLAVEGFVVEALQRLLQVQPLVTSQVPPALAAQYWQWLGRLGIDGRLPASRGIEALQRAETMYREQGNDRHLHACLRMKAEAMLGIGGFAAAQAALDEAQQMEHTAWPVADRMRRLRVQGMLLDRMGRLEESLQVAERAYRLAQDDRIERYVLILLADMAAVHLKMGHAERAAEQYRTLAAKARGRASDGLTLSHALAGLTAALVAHGRFDDARSVAVEAVPLLHRSGLLVARSDIFAWLAAREGAAAAAARLLGAADAFHQRSESMRGPVELNIRAQVMGLLAAAHAAEDVAGWMAEGAAMDEDALAGMLAAALPPV
jgi:predicted ATPase/DNA-binding winged helix-turn-helix (wHTH) protein